MFYFAENNGITMYFGKKAILKNITAWVNPSLFPWDKTTFDGKRLLKLKSVEEQTVTYYSLNEKEEYKLTVSEENGAFALRLSGKYEPILGAGSHLDVYNGVGIDFDMPKKGNYVDFYMMGNFWQSPKIFSKYSEILPRTQAMLVNHGAFKTYLQTTCDKDFKSEILSNGKLLSLAAHANCVLDTIDDCILVGMCGNDEYALPEGAVSYGFKVMNKAGKLRKNKKYPEIFEYLGWCSWDAFHMDVTKQNLLDKSKEFKDKNIPVRWMIIDDMWGDVNAIDRKTMYDREINRWEADPARFPDGLKGAVKDITEKYGIKVGIWHPTSGYWHGINPNGELAHRYPELLEYTIPKVNNGDTRLVHSYDREKCLKYYMLQHKFYKDCGIAFTKVDNQGSTENLTHFKGSIGKCSSNLHNAIEKTAKKYYDGALINCMGMPVENFWNRTYANVNRFSGDFMPDDRKWFVTHLLQCSYNAYSQGVVFTGDWDMWWSDDAQARKNAVLRAMSGGPIYMSDELNRSIREVIMPTVYSDGRIVRLKNPALPVRECLFENVGINKKTYKVFNSWQNCGVVASFNMDDNEATVSGSVSPEDVPSLKAGRYAAYDWFNGVVTVLDKGEKLELELKNYDDFRLHWLVPIINGKAVIGLKEKYMAPATVKKVKGGVTVNDDGTLLVYSEAPLSGFNALNGCLYAKKVKKDEQIII